MNNQRMHGVGLFTAGVVGLLALCAFYSLIIGIFEMRAAIIALIAFIALAVLVWTRPDDRSATRHS